MRTTYATLTSSCVSVPDRLDPDKQLGVFPPKLRGKGDYRDLHKVPCKHEAEEHIAADQIFPLIRMENWYTPTIKHHCCKTALASSLRACSNKVSFDPNMYKRYALWFRNKFIPKFTSCLANELWDVDFEKWLERYPIAYRNKMRQAIDPDHQTTLGKCNKRYEAFTKVEMQFTTVPHDLKDTELNDVKERQICGPVDEKKVWGNAFINLLEEVATKYFKPYCGRSNWVEICEHLEAMENELKQIIYGASDGSGFDMTQYPEMNQLMNELLEACARHPNVNWKEPLTIERFLEVIKNSLILHVDVDHGDLKYEAVGRASGDGWTTFGNTMLMISYWMFTFELAGIDKYLLKVKGDDVLFGLTPQEKGKFEIAVKQVFTSGKHEHTHGLGQICKKINYGSLTELDFLSNEFFLTKDGHYRMTRIPARVIQTISWTTKLPECGRNRENIRRQLCYSKGKCLKAWADGLPIFNVLADKMIQLGTPGKYSEWDQWSDGARVWHQGRNDYDAYLQYLDEHYNLSRGEVLEVEKAIKNVKSLSGILHLPQLERLMLLA